MIYGKKTSFSIQTQLVGCPMAFMDDRMDIFDRGGGIPFESLGIKLARHFSIQKNLWSTWNMFQQIWCLMSSALVSMICILLHV